MGLVLLVSLTARVRQGEANDKHPTKVTRCPEEQSPPCQTLRNDTF